MVNAKNISRNPMIAYQQGYKEGFQNGELKRSDDDTRLGMNFVYNLLLVCLYNANEDLSKPKLKALYERLSLEVKNQVNNYIDGEEGISIADAVDLMAYHDSQVRKMLGMPSMDYSKEGGMFDGKEN